MNNLRAISLVVGLIVGLAWLRAPLLAADAKAEAAADRIANRPKVAGQFVLHQRNRTEAVKGSGQWKEQNKEVVWNASETAINRDSAEPS